ncbi:MAG: hypothetical protein ACRD1M_00660, partial [Terriglobales bacterium]
AYYTAAVEGAFNYTGTAAAGGLQGSANSIGIQFWAWGDSTGEETNWGLVSFLDNPYDGVSDVVAAGTDAWGFATGGEAANYGNFIGPVTSANQAVVAALTAAGANW